jgi:hypothetical protein
MGRVQGQPFQAHGLLEVPIEFSLAVGGIAQDGMAEVFGVPANLVHPTGLGPGPDQAGAMLRGIGDGGR